MKKIIILIFLFSFSANAQMINLIYPLDYQIEQSIYIDSMKISNFNYKVFTFTNADATPDISGGNFFKTNSTSLDTITDFNGDPGTGYVKFLWVMITNSNTVWTSDNTKIWLSGGISFKGASGDVLVFLWDGTRYSEVARNLK